MTEEHKDFEKKIKRKHSFGWTPRYEESNSTKLNKTLFVAIAIKAFEKLGWLVVYADDKSVEAKRKKDWGQYVNKITVSYDLGKINIKSVSLGNEMWDLGHNSQRVKLFIHVFQEIENSYDSEALKELEIAVEKENNLDDYKIPDVLPKPVIKEEGKIYIPLVGGILTALALGYILAFLSINVMNIIFLYEVGVAFLLAYAFFYFIKLSNYLNLEIVSYLFIGAIIITYVSNQYFQFEIIMSKNNFEPISFIEYMKIRFDAGLVLENIDTGWIGLVISWVLQFVISYYLGTLTLFTRITSYLIELVPMEVIDFAYYHFVKGKNEKEVREALAEKGWTEKSNQDEVFDALNALQSAVEINRME